MGHIHLGVLPSSRKWREVVDLLTGGAADARIVAASAAAAEKDLLAAARKAWTRNMSFKLPVRCPEIWNRQTCAARSLTRWSFSPATDWNSRSLRRMKQPGSETSCPSRQRETVRGNRGNPLLRWPRQLCRSSRGACSDIGPERPLSGLLAPGAVLGLTRITLEYKEKSPAVAGSGVRFRKGKWRRERDCGPTFGTPAGDQGARQSCVRPFIILLKTERSRHL